MRLVDFTNAFAQARLKETFYVELPKLYESPDSSDVHSSQAQVTIWVSASTAMSALLSKRRVDC